MRTRGWVTLVLVGLATLLLAGRAATSLIVDRTWFAAFNAEPIFWEQFVDTVLLRGGIFVLGSAFAFLNVHAVRRTILAVAVPTRVGNIDIPEMVSPQRLLIYSIATSVLIALVVAIPFDDWTLVALVRHGVPFVDIEGYFSRDLGFYVYWLPLEETLYVWALLAIVMVSGVVIVLYAITRSLRLEGRRIIASTHVRRHLTVLSVLVMLMLAWSYRLDGYDLLRYGSGPDGLFLRVDHVLTTSIDRILALSMACASLVLLRAGWLGHIRTALVTLSLVLIGSLGVRHIVPAIVSRTNAIGDPAKRELDYIATRALFSRRAYDVDGIAVAHADSATARETDMRIGEVPRAFGVWDASVLLRAVRLQSSSLVPVEPLTWTRGASGLQAVVVERPSSNGGSWSVLRVEGSTADMRGGPITTGAENAAQIDSTSFVTDDDATGSIPDPLIAPGAAGHRLVVDSTSRIIGARLDSWSARIAHAWATRDPRMLGDDTTDVVPTLVQWRDVRARVRRLAPIFAQATDVLPVVYDGTLYWTLDLYSATDNYPLSAQLKLAGDIRTYFHHAATAVVNSKTGRVQLVSVLNPDPIARTWMNVAPSLFTSVARLPSALSEVLPPPSDGAVAQIQAFARYGSRLDGPAVHHFADTTWLYEIPPSQLIDDKTPTVGWAVPLLDGPEQIGGVALVMGGAQRGVRWVSTVAPFSRWSALTRRLRNALDSTRLSLTEAGKREPRVNFGHIRAGLVGGSPVLVQPMYMDRLNGAPALVRVGIVTANATSVGTSLSDAVRRLPGVPDSLIARNSGNRTPRVTANRDATIARLYDSMKSAMQHGDFARFGIAFDSLGVLIGRPPR